MSWSLGFILFMTSMGWQILAIKPEKNRKYYRKCSNNFAADCKPTNTPVSVHYQINTTDTKLLKLGDRCKYLGVIVLSAAVYCIYLTY